MTRLAGVTLAVLASAPLSAQPRTPPAPIPSPSLAIAEMMLAAATAKATELGVRLTCVVVDVRGDLVAAARMDGAPFWTVETALGKARASAVFGGPSGADRPDLQSIAAASGLTIFTIQGALPIVTGTQRTGAIGCSGASGQQDEDAARAGIATQQ